jgi:hypothetical protein
VSDPYNADVAPSNTDTAPDRTGAVFLELVDTSSGVIA